MTSYGLIMCAYIFDLLDIGLIGKRGRIILGLIAAALAWAWWIGPSGWIGVAAAALTILGLRRGKAWLEAGGWEIIGLVLLEAARWASCYAGDMLRRALEVFSPPRTHEAPPLELPEPVPPPGDTAQVALPHGDRWGLLTPAVTPGVALHSVETYSDWLPTAVERHHGTNAAARAAETRWGISRRTFYRDLQKLRKEAA